MSGSNSAERKRHEPLVLVETADLSEEDWLDYRRRGIGGSDVSAIFGTSPFRTARDLYYDKLNIASVEDDEGNWVAMEMGHLLEPLVAKIFERKTGYPVYQIKKMFQHPQYPWMLADVDYFVELPDGTTAILEIKTTNYNARDNWWMNGKETVPVYYESQGRHYMTVTDLDRCFFCCLYGNNEEEVIIREVKRDFEYEAEMVFLEQYFWENHVQRHVPPPYTESGALIIESARKHFGPADKNAPTVALDLDSGLCRLCSFRFLGFTFSVRIFRIYSFFFDQSFGEVDFLQSLILLGKQLICQFVIVAGDKSHMSYAVIFKTGNDLRLFRACQHSDGGRLLLFFILRGFLGIIHIDAV